MTFSRLIRKKEALVELILHIQSALGDVSVPYRSVSNMIGDANVIIRMRMCFICDGYLMTLRYNGAEIDGDNIKITTKRFVPNLLPLCSVCANIIKGGTVSCTAIIDRRAQKWLMFYQAMIGGNDLPNDAMWLIILKYCEIRSLLDYCTKWQ